MKLVLVSSAAILLSACTTTVNLTVRNLEAIPLELRVVTYDSRGLSRNELDLGPLLATATRKATPFSVKKGGRFEVVALVPGAIVFKQSHTVTGRENPMNVELDVRVQNGRILDDSRALRTISDSFKKLGPDVVNAYPLELRTALRTRFGALLVVRSGKEVDRTPLVTITPEVLGVRVVKLEEIDYPKTREIDKTEVSGTTSATAKVSVPLYGALTGSLSDSSIYQVEWTLQGFGVIPKLEDPSRTVAVQFMNLPQAERDRVRRTLRDNPGSKVIYVNNIYVVERALLKMKEGKKQSSNVEVSGASVVTVTGAFSFGESSEATREYSGFVLNYFGDEMVLQSPAGSSTTWKGPGDSTPVFLKRTGGRTMIRPSAFDDLPKAKDTLGRE